ncbi:G2 M phase-specific E3 ubiquitin- ligase-like [Paramuricea clavata]|uniref:G2 M phase-specific E3 ubiquitin- ligase-like n=1 Tax=Paramuricea clavata TaxID=317549 RepID=A0A7D9DE36_PARCT|nr:G2 M phase-specific E3 ubiquitin- ligase-like [Paramuricea clavata]
MNVAFDPETPLHITFIDKPAIDGGGLLRQFFTDLFSCIIEGKPMSLFLGECGRNCPTHSPQGVFLGMIEIVGKIIAHSLVQGSCYYYLATGDMIGAMAYCNPWDIPDVITRQWILWLIDANSESDMADIATNDQFLDVLSSCGDTSVPKVNILICQ